MILVVVISVLLVAIAAVCDRSPAHVVLMYACLWVLFFVVDGLHVEQTARAVLSPSVTHLLPRGGLARVYFVAVLTGLASFVTVASLGSRLIRPARRGDEIIVVRLRILIALHVLAASLVVRAVLAYGLRQTLQLRQQTFGTSATSALAYHLFPATFLIVASIAIHKDGTTKLRLLAVLSLPILVMTGSRSSLLLTIVLPLAHLSAARVRRGGLFTARTRKRALWAALLLFAYFVAVPYVTAARGTDLTTTQSVLDYSDVSAADATLLTMSDRLHADQGITYLSLLSSVLPNAVVGPDIPSGNQLFSMLETPQRYGDQRVEATVSILGEASLNFGPQFAGPLAGTLLAALVLGMIAGRTRLARASPWLAQAVFYSMAYRGVNAIRGDFQNIALPLTFLLLIATLITPRIRSGASVPRTVEMAAL